MDTYRYVPTLYTDQRTIYNQGPDYDPPPQRPQPRPAAPAVTVPAEHAPATAPAATPSTVWRRNHHQQLSTPSPAIAATPMPFSPGSGRGGDPDAPIGSIVYQSLQRPHLLRGGEWQLSVATNLLAAAFIVLAIMSWNWRFLPGALFFGGPIQWLLRVMADHDPKRWQKYVRTIGQPLIREPHGKPGETAPAPALLPKPTWFIH
jgi:type IV secretory pathway TrbD component